MRFQTLMPLQSASQAAVGRTEAVRPPVPSASNSQQNFNDVLASQSGQGAAVAGQYAAAANNPFLKGLMSSGGGYGLEAFLNASGMLGDDDLQDVLVKLASVNPASLVQVADPVHGLGRRDPAVATGRRTSRTGSAGFGSLCEKFESGALGVAAVGYDSVGGTSYGLYQIASKVGTMGEFLEFLDDRAPDLSRRLREAGPANTGSRDGKMPKVWQEIAAENPKRFADLQRDFIRDSHYAPASQAIKERTGLDVERQSPVLKEVLWSTAVQHGPAGAARIFAGAVESAKLSGGPFEETLVGQVYERRATQFGSSSAGVQAAVQRRFQQERALAMLMMGGQKA